MQNIYYTNEQQTTTAVATLAPAAAPKAYANIILDAIYNDATLTYDYASTINASVPKTATRTYAIQATKVSCYTSGYALKVAQIDKFTESSSELDDIIAILNELYADFWFGDGNNATGKLTIDKSTDSRNSPYRNASMELSKDKEILMYEYNAEDFEDVYKDETNLDNPIKNIRFEIKDNTNRALSSTLQYLYIIPSDFTKLALNDYVAPSSLTGNQIYLSSTDYTAQDSVDFVSTQENSVNKKDKVDSLSLNITGLNKEDYFNIEVQSTTDSNLKYFEYAKKFDGFLTKSPTSTDINNNIDDIYIKWDKYVKIGTEYFPLYIKTNDNNYKLVDSDIELINSSQYQLILDTTNIGSHITLYQDTKNNINNGRHLFLENYARRLSYIESFSQNNPYPDTNYTLNQLGILINKDTQEEKTLNGTFSIKNPFGDVGTLVKINGYDNEGNLVDPSVSGVISINDESDAWRKPIINKMSNPVVIAPQNENGTIYASIVTKGGIAAAKTIKGERLYGAVWNDYAEYRQTPNVAPGRCVIEQGDGTLHQSTERLQPGASIVSDTYGFGVGETALAKTPIAVSGRVLAYPYEDRNSYKPGAAVCSGPNGTISMMTREEIREWPDCIVGTVSEIPQYEKWGTDAVNVDGRIWIKIK